MPLARWPMPLWADIPRRRRGREFHEVPVRSCTGTRISMRLYCTGARGPGSEWGLNVLPRRG